jgi:hypothetical protein
VHKVIELQDLGSAVRMTIDRPIQLILITSQRGSPATPATSYSASPAPISARNRSVPGQRTPAGGDKSSGNGAVWVPSSACRPAHTPAPKACIGGVGGDSLKPSAARSHGRGRSGTRCVSSRAFWATTTVWPALIYVWRLGKASHHTSSRLKRRAPQRVEPSSSRSTQVGDVAKDGTATLPCVSWERLTQAH